MSYIFYKVKHSSVRQCEVRQYAKFEDLTAVLLKIQFLLDVMPCRPVED
jgi:hypothetical protein